MLKQRFLKVFIVLNILIPCCVWADSFVPWDFTVNIQKKDTEKENVSVSANLLIMGIKFFQEYISPIDGDRCNMYPTCSDYSVQAIKKHGALIGFVMTADRLIHESDEMNYAKLVKVGKRFRYYDPVENNDFWWHKGNYSEQPK